MTNLLLNSGLNQDKMQQVLSKACESNDTLEFNVDDSDILIKIAKDLDS